MNNFDIQIRQLIQCALADVTIQFGYELIVQLESKLAKYPYQLQHIYLQLIFPSFAIILLYLVRPSLRIPTYPSILFLLNRWEGKSRLDQRTSWYQCQWRKLWCHCQQKMCLLCVCLYVCICELHLEVDNNVFFRCTSTTSTAVHWSTSDFSDGNWKILCFPNCWFRHPVSAR